VFMVVYDENGGWFDHVPPPTPGPMVTRRADIPTSNAYAGEYITASLPATPSDLGHTIYGPVGMGFRVPCLVISPFSRGGNVCSTAFDHTSTLKFIAERFLGNAADVPNISPWRLGATGNMIKALPGLTQPDMTVPNLPLTSLAFPEDALQNLLYALAGTEDYALPYPPPTTNKMPAQEFGITRRQLGSYDSLD
jgi:phospholipase C